MCRSRCIAILALTLTAAFARSAPAAETVMVDGVPHVRNGATPRDGIVSLQLEEQWRIGSEEEDVLLGLVTRVCEDDAGNLYILDAQLSQVHVYDRGGTKLRTLFREGEGPGEIRGPRDLVLLDDGRVGAVQEMPGKLIFVDRMGIPAGTLRIGGAGVELGGFCQTFSAFAGSDLLVIAGFIQTPGQKSGHMEQTSFLASFDATGKETTRFCETVNDIDFADFTFDELRHLAAYWWNTAIGPDGRVYVAPYLDRYEIHVLAADGTLERVIERESEPWLRTAEEREHFAEAVRAIYHGAPIEVGVAASNYEPTILYLQRGLRVNADGTIWVLTTRGVREQAAGVMATFDVFDPHGEFVRQVAVRAPWDGRRAGVFLFDDDHAVVITGYTDAMMAQFSGGHLSVDVADEAASMEVIRCRVTAR